MILNLLKLDSSTTDIFGNTHTFTSFFSLKLQEILASVPFHCMKCYLAKVKCALKFTESWKLISYKNAFYFRKVNININLHWIFLHEINHSCKKCPDLRSQVWDPGSRFLALAFRSGIPSPDSWVLDLVFQVLLLGSQVLDPGPFNSNC